MSIKILTNNNMSNKKQEPIVQEMRSLLPYYLAVAGVYFAVILVLFFALEFDYTLILGAIWGNIVCIANFYLLGKTAQIAVRKSPKAAQTYMNTMYCLRYLGIFATMTTAALLPFFDLIAAVVPLIFPKIVITIRAIREKE